MSPISFIFLNQFRWNLVQIISRYWHEMTVSFVKADTVKELLLLRAFNKVFQLLCLIFFNSVQEVSTKICWVAASLVKMGVVTAIIYVNSKWISVCTFYTYWMILMKFSVRHLHVTLLNLSAFRAKSVQERQNIAYIANRITLSLHSGNVLHSERKERLLEDWVLRHRVHHLRSFLYFCLTTRLTFRQSCHFSLINDCQVTWQLNHLQRHQLLRVNAIISCQIWYHTQRSNCSTRHVFKFRTDKLRTQIPKIRI